VSDVRLHHIAASSIGGSEECPHLSDGMDVNFRTMLIIPLVRRGVL
jgi:hypothetical protein